MYIKSIILIAGFIFQLSAFSQENRKWKLSLGVDVLKPFIYSQNLNGPTFELTTYFDIEHESKFCPKITIGYTDLKYITSNYKNTYSAPALKLGTDILFRTKDYRVKFLLSAYLGAEKYKINTVATINNPVWGNIVAYNKTTGVMPTAYLGIGASRQLIKKVSTRLLILTSFPMKNYPEPNAAKKPKGFEIFNVGLTCTGNLIYHF